MNKKLIVLIILLMISWFYWFQWRPVKIRSYCHQWIVDLPGEIEDIDMFYYESGRAAYNALYYRCLHEKGLK